MSEAEEYDGAFSAVDLVEAPVAGDETAESVTGTETKKKAKKKTSTKTAKIPTAKNVDVTLLTSMAGSPSHGAGSSKMGVVGSPLGVGGSSDMGLFALAAPAEGSAHDGALVGFQNNIDGAPLVKELQMGTLAVNTLKSQGPQMLGGKVAKWVAVPNGKFVKKRDGGFSWRERLTLYDLHGYSTCPLAEDVRVAALVQRGSVLHKAICRWQKKQDSEQPSRLEPIRCVCFIFLADFWSIMSSVCLSWWVGSGSCDCLE